MTVESQELRFRTRREGEILDITDKTQRIVDSSKLKNGVAALFVPGSTGALTTIEYEPGLLTDFPITLERFAPKEAPYDPGPVPLSFLWRHEGASSRKFQSFAKYRI
jgi:thiamine phosphate synthase YjbQ (UPF0047 family)